MHLNLFYRVGILIGLLIATATFAQTGADSGFNPETVMLSHFTFTRPTTWKWANTRSDVTNVVQAVTLQVNYPGAGDDCRVYLNHFQPGKPAGSLKVVTKRWREFFGDPPDSAVQTKHGKVGKTKITYTEISGTYKGEGSKAGVSRPDFILFGVVAEDPAGNLVMRLIGPAKSVQRAKPDFKKMIEDALKE